MQSTLQPISEKLMHSSIPFFHGQSMNEVNFVQIRKHPVLISSEPVWLRSFDLYIIQYLTFVIHKGLRIKLSKGGMNVCIVFFWKLCL